LEVVLDDDRDAEQRPASVRVAANCRSSESAIESAFGFVRMIALIAGPRLSYASIRARYPATMA
jgi:hypothetical protein